MSMESCDISQDRSILFFEFPHSIINAEHYKVNAEGPAYYLVRVRTKSSPFSSTDTL
jgi:hypothetical protein